MAASKKLRSRDLLLAASAAVLLFLLVVTQRAREEHPSRRDTQLDDPAEGEPIASAAPRSAPAPTAAPVVPAPRPPGEPSSITADPEGLQARRIERVSRALEVLRFPPDSQPLHAHMVDVLHPGARHDTPLPLVGERSFLFTANTYAVARTRPVVATLEVFRGRTPSDRRHVPVEIRACSLGRFGQPDYHVVASALDLNDQGRSGDAAAGDGVYTLAFVPSAVPGLTAHNGLIRLDVELVVEGETTPARASLDFRMTSAPPAAFLGVSGERLTDDGLEIAVELRVERAGRYFVQGLLFDARDRPIGVAVVRRTLEPGRAVVPLLYWGLLFHDATAVAPFTFRTLTGQRLPDPGEVEGADLATWDAGYRTGSYALTDFSDKEHESAAKTRKVQMLGELAGRKAARTPADVE